jgi:hypothetical protein
MTMNGRSVLSALPVLLILASDLSFTRQNMLGQSARDRFVGAWRLVSLEEEGANGFLQRADCVGMLMFARDGHMSVQVMYRNPQTANNAYAVGGYEASFGRYEIDEAARTFTFHVDSAIARSHIGTDLPRKYTLSATRLVVSSTDPKERWRVTWEHY